MEPIRPLWMPLPLIMIHKHPASTLIELILYFVLLAVGLMVAMNFAVQIGDLYGQSANNNELQSNANLLETRFSYAVETATGINAGASSFGVDAGRVSLTMSDAAKSPTAFYLQSGVIYMQEGNAAAVALTTPVVYVNYFRLTRITPTKAPSQIVMDAQISIANVSRQEMGVEIPVHLTVTLRQ